MPRDTDEVINEPITADEFSADDLPDDGDLEGEGLDDELADAGIGEDDLDADVDIGEDEIDPVGDLGMEDDPMGGMGGGGDFGMDDDEFDDELGAGLEDDLPEMVAPEEKVKWTAVPQENGDIWSEHVEGFVLRARPLSAQQGSKIKYAVQLFKDKQMIEKGVIYVDQNEDAREYLQNISDRILDRMNMVNLSQVEATPGEGFGGEEEIDLGLGGEGEEAAEEGAGDELDAELDLGEEGTEEEEDLGGELDDLNL